MITSDSGDESASQQAAEPIAAAEARQTPTRRIAPHRQLLTRAALSEWGAMAAVVAIAATLNFWNLQASGYGNLYYTAAVRSMAQNWHNFFFAAYDPGGFVTVDKPPLGFWAQVLSVKLLGFNGFSLLLPEALAGVLSVVVIWRLARRAFGPTVGVLAALALAISPVNVVANRDNILEPLLTLTLLLAAWAVSEAARQGKLRWLLVGAALVGLGFNIKMLEAYLIVPALVVVYAVCAPGSRPRRARDLALAGALMLAISFAWVVAVDLTPASQRPYVGSTTTNSEMELALSYNGAGRLLGGLKLSFPHLTPIGVRGPKGGSASAVQPSHGATSVFPQAPPPRPHHAHHRSEAQPSAIGVPGPLRLLQPALGSQVSWLLPLALAGALLLAGGELGDPLAPKDGAGQRFRRTRTHARLAGWQREPRAQGLLLWGSWLLTGGVLFSFARSINAYYVAIYAPAICALAAVGAVELGRLYRRSFAGWREAWLSLPLPLALVATALLQSSLLGAAPGWQPWLAATLAPCALALAGALGLLRLVPGLSGWFTRRDGRTAPLWLVNALATVALAATVIAPTAWSLASLTWGNAGGWPSAGPAFARAHPSPRQPLVDGVMVRYLMQHRGEDRFIVGALNAYLTAPLIVVTGQPVLDMGGFTGDDPILTQHVLARLVDQDQVHLFLLPSANVTEAQRAALFPPVALRGAARTNGASPPSVTRTAYTNSLTRWISLHCAPVPPREWSAGGQNMRQLGAWELFACQS